MSKYLPPAIAVFLLLIATDTLPALRGGAGWQWSHQEPETWTPVITLAGVLLLYLGAVWLSRRWSVVVRLVLGVVGGVVITFAVLAIENDPLFLLFTRTVSPVQTGASTIAVRSMAQDGVQETLAEWPQVMDEAQKLNIIHFTTHPPAQPLLHYWAAKLLEPVDTLDYDLRQYQCANEQVMDYTSGEILSVGWWGMLMPLWAMLAVVPIFFTTCHLSGDTQRAVDVAQWWAIVPSILLFTPTWNTFYPLLCITAFYVLLYGVQRPGWMLLAGLILGAVTLMTFSVTPVGLLFMLYVLGWWWFMTGRELTWLVVRGLLFLTGIIVLWAALWAYSGTSPVEIFTTGIENHRELVQRADYTVWIFLHLYDLFLFAGWALVGIAVLGMVIAYRAWQRSGEMTAHRLLALALGITMILVALSGTAQGETARLLTFYIPFMLVVGALTSLTRDWMLLGMQAATVVVLASFLVVVPLDLEEPPEEPRQDVPFLDLGELRPADVGFDSDRFRGAFTLDSYRYIPNPAEQVIAYEFRWRGEERTERPYQFRLIATTDTDEDGEPLTITSEPYVWYPQSGNYLTTCWQDGDEIRDVIVMPLPPVPKPVVWTVTLETFDERTQESLGIVELEPVRYP